MIGLIPLIPAIEIPRISIKPPTVIKFETMTSRDLEDEFDLQWLEVAERLIYVRSIHERYCYDQEIYKTHIRTDY